MSKVVNLDSFRKESVPRPAAIEQHRETLRITMQAATISLYKLDPVILTEMSELFDGWAKEGEVVLSDSISRGRFVADRAESIAAYVCAILPSVNHEDLATAASTELDRIAGQVVADVKNGVARHIISNDWQREIEKMTDTLVDKTAEQLSAPAIIRTDAPNPRNG